MTERKSLYSLSIHLTDGKNMLLTKNGKLLGKRRKVFSDGGSSNRLLYSLDVDAFNLTTLSDSGVQWALNGNSIQLNKGNGGLNIQFVSGSKSYLILPKSSIRYNSSKNHRIKMNLSYIEFAAATLTVGCYPQCFSYGWNNARGQWALPNDVDMIDPSLYIRTFGSTRSLVNRPAVSPWNTTWDILHEDGVTNIYVYWDDMLACRIKNADISDLFMTTTDYNGSSYSQLITLSSYEIWEF